MWDFVDSSNKMLDPSVETVLKNFPLLRLLPGKFSSFYKDALKCRDAIIQRFYDDFKVSVRLPFIYEKALNIYLGQQ